MGSNRIELTWLAASLVAANQQQRFYVLRFMWTAIASFEKMGLPPEQINELRGIYTGLAEGVLFSDFIDQQKKADSPSQPHS
ncbi:hypothetical protein DXZ20_12615 [Leptolyngbyaceae cyanobacterium CCMR0081]|uniref:Uncharacterized protein n=2 Tax=Adonisia TaxID=2950183 RepID=A0A6M0RL18_9CYAN|nr:hypothetical protein [Adonisia turfae CCMR0081]